MISGHDDLKAKIAFQFETENSIPHRRRVLSLQMSSSERARPQMRREIFGSWHKRGIAGATERIGGR